jgi:hypothetical protein
MTRYRLKPTAYVNAMQWIPGDLAATGRIIGTLMADGVPTRHPSGMGPTTTIQIEGDPAKEAQPGDWLIRTDDREWDVIEATDFALRYEPVPASEEPTP